MNRMFNRYNTKAFRENPLICANQIKFMKPRLLILSCIILMIVGCSKDKYQTQPTISIKSYSSAVSPGGNFNAVFNYTQNNGNLTGDSLYVFKHLHNSANVPIGTPQSDTAFSILPETPQSSLAEFNININYNNLYIDLGGDNDTIDLKFVLVDLAGRHSDTVQTGKVILLSQ